MEPPVEPPLARVSRQRAIADKIKSGGYASIHIKMRSALNIAETSTGKSQEGRISPTSAGAESKELVEYKRSIMSFIVDHAGTLTMMEKRNIMELLESEGADMSVGAADTRVILNYLSLPCLMKIHTIVRNSRESKDL